MSALGSPQRGVVLLVSLIMMVLLTLLALVAINMSSVNLRLTWNEQARSESIAAAQLAIEQVATTNFPANPQPVTVSVDVNRDGTADYAVAVAKPVCLNSVPIRTDSKQLNLNNPADVACFASGAAQNTGIVGTGVSGNSNCSNTQWDVNATTTDNANSGATVNVHQGIGMRVAIGTPC
jgi:Tfp pilus assembly protein PilX